MNEKELNEYLDQEVFETIMNIYWIINEKAVDCKVKTDAEELLINAMDIGAYYFESNVEFNHFYIEVCRKITDLNKWLISNLEFNDIYEFLISELKTFEGKFNYIAGNKININKGNQIIRT